MPKTEQYYPPQQVVVAPRTVQQPLGNPEQIVIEPSDTDINQSEFDENTVRSNMAQRGRRMYDQDLPTISPRMQVTRAVPTYQAPLDRMAQMNLNDDPVVKVEEAFNASQKRYAKPDLSRDQWIDIQQKIDSEYERKLKAVGDDAMYKLKSF
jgi:hypothetical protein